MTALLVCVLQWIVAGVVGFGVIVGVFVLTLIIGGAVGHLLENVVSRLPDRTLKKLETSTKRIVNSLLVVGFGCLLFVGLLLLPALSMYPLLFETCTECTGTVYECDTETGEEYTR